MKYFALLTKLGENLLAQATALGTKLELTHMAVGDGGGKLPTPDTNQTKLIKEQRRAAINTLFIDEQNKNQIIAEQIIPEKDGGWWIREIGLFDKAGNLIAVANCPETYKPQLEEGSGRTQAIRMVLIVSHTESVSLKIDPSVVLATREYVDNLISAVDLKIQSINSQVIYKSALEIPVDADLNDYLIAGLYFQPRGKVGTNAKNYPIDEAGSLEVVKTGNTSVKQVYTAWISFKTFTRRYDGGSKKWYGWEETYTTQNKPTHNDLGLDSIYLRIENPATSAKKLEKPSRIAGHVFYGQGEDITITPDDVFNQAVSIPLNADLNSYTNAGLFYQALGNQGENAKNYPMSEAGSLEVVRTGSSSVKQVYTTWHSLKTFTRRYNGSTKTWAEKWDEDYTKLNPPTPAELNVYSIPQADNKFQQKGNYQPKGDYVDKTTTSEQVIKGSMAVNSAFYVTSDGAGSDLLGLVTWGGAFGFRKRINNTYGGTVEVPYQGGTIALVEQTMGINQSWKNVTSARNVGVSYTNTTKKPIFIALTGQAEGDGSAKITVDNVTVATLGGIKIYSINRGISFIVPAGSKYFVESTAIITAWSELS
ncbi:phage tail-collar fiber domain-containing protein [Providencia sp. PROV259]|uniref:phage tail-collar fiber domain-containing protein n=1 Tax=Providencia sp. PROV259 TaxID=2949947 RepID=UPI00234A3A71|nr:phage tail protein [Providencia sp. PROV259]